MSVSNPEKRRLAEPPESGWKTWGPYLSERQWGTVREDYSPGGTAWDYFPHEMARSRAYRWGEDGIAGMSDREQRLCLALALWNGRDHILKERFFGVTNEEGNHGEDVKELYYYVDATPTHSYLKMIYQYPHAAFPYAQLVEENRRRGRHEPEYEIADTGVFEEDRYFDVEIEYAKAAPDDILMQVTVYNRSAEEAVVHVLPHLWFRNTWSWKREAKKPSVRLVDHHAVRTEHHALGNYHFYSENQAHWLFTENETNVVRLYGIKDAHGPFKDAIGDYVVGGLREAVSAHPAGTKTAAHLQCVAPGKGHRQFRLRLSATAQENPFADFGDIVSRRREEADLFYAELQRGLSSADERGVQRRAFAGLIWSKQFYHYDVPLWLTGDVTQPAPPRDRWRGRNAEWRHLNNADVISMPDKWEYPWYAAWDLAFHCIPFSIIDSRFAKNQLILLLREWYMHPNGQLPAYEWALGDVNPPVHAWAAWRVFQIDRKRHGKGDIAFLERVFHKLMLNFTWWVNRKDAQGRNLFQGGFLGLDNIGVFDRSKPLPTGGFMHQADATSWMAMYCLNLLRIALELALHNDVYEDIATKFFEHFLHIAAAMNNMGESGIGLWDAEDEFYYDVLNTPDGHSIPLKVRSMVGLIPLFAVETIEPTTLRRLPKFAARLEWFLKHRPDLAGLVSRWHEPGRGDRRLLSILRGHRMKRLLARMLDEEEFLSDYGVRSLSRHHLHAPYRFRCDGSNLDVSYQPGESTSGVFGGNSNWRGPVWMPLNYLIIESLQKFHHYYGDDFKVECPARSGRFLTLTEVADEIARRLKKAFLKGADGVRPIMRQESPQPRHRPIGQHLLFYEYLHGETGRGAGASHQTGWTALLAKLMMPRGGPQDTAATP
jgi:hypothetical protein